MPSRRPSGCCRGLRAARLSCPWAAPAWMLVGGRLGSGDRGTSLLGDEPWGIGSMGPCASYVAPSAKKEDRTGPQTPSSHSNPYIKSTAPTLTLQHTEHIIQPDLASTARRIAHVQTQQTPGCQGSALDPFMWSQHKGGYKPG